MKLQNELNTRISRRKFLGNASALTAAALLPGQMIAAPYIAKFGMAKDPFVGVNIGAITYSFRSMPGTAEDLLNYLSQVGLKHVEFMGDPIEAYAGAPKGPGWQRGQATPEQQEERRKYQEELRKWRLAAPMDKFKKLRKMYKSEGVQIDVVKFGLDRMTEEEIDYCFNVAKAMGAKGITLERSDDAVQKLAPFATKHKRMIGYHNHARVNFNSWDAALTYSPYNALNLDVGHYVAGTNESPIPLIQKYHDRILNLHLKDRKKNEGDNMPWGQGDTPLKEILQLMKKEKYQFMAAIELEYPIPEGSDAVKEVKKCVEFCQNALG